MLKTSFQAIVAAARNVFGNWRAVLIAGVVYAALLAALYTFVVVREASMFQVVLTFVLALAAPLLFFWLQSLIVGGIAEEHGRSVGQLLKRSAADLWKIIVVTLPLLALGVLIGYLLMKAQTRWGAPIPDEAPELPRRAAAAARDASRPVDWKIAGLSTLRYLLFGLVLPLAAIHVWLATARDGLVPALKRVGGIIGRAFSPQSVLIYIVGFIVFGVIPYFILFKSTTSTRAWLDVSLLATRLAVVFALTLLGWVITIKALSLSAAAPALTADKAV
ncbi:MAG TPA: hypothetical protein VJV03_03885 [Pyrinomonadaceae bacterium]|nr:hypothetical protein [Pyrinomonadaceae bacterium]